MANEIITICQKIDSLHCKILKSKFAETVTESEMLSLIFAVKELNRQKAENERLREYEEIRPIGCPNCSRGNFSNSKYCSHCGIQLQGKNKDLISEAIKEFAEKLKESAVDCDVSFGYGKEHYTKAVSVIEIDDLVKEMVGEQE